MRRRDPVPTLTRTAMIPLVFAVLLTASSSADPSAITANGAKGASNVPQDIRKIKHGIVIMQENRSSTPISPLSPEPTALR